MAQVIIFSNDSGGVSVCVPTGEMDIEAVKAKDTPSGSIIVDSADLPQADNDFFNAWELADGVVTVNLTKAKALTKDRLRMERAPLLAAQDVLFQRAQETGADTTAIVAEKNRLRDITNLVDGCTTTSQLRQLTPASTEVPALPVVEEAPVVEETPAVEETPVVTETPAQGT
jgi:hypothetical protein